LIATLSTKLGLKPSLAFGKFSVAEMPKLSIQVQVPRNRHTLDAVQERYAGIHPVGLADAVGRNPVDFILDRLGLFQPHRLAFGLGLAHLRVKGRDATDAVFQAVNERWRG
jgi:hypothetical protein